MKVLLTSHQFVPEFFAGTEILTYTTAKELQRRGHEVAVFTACPAQAPMKDSDRFDHYVHDGIPVERFWHAVVPMGGYDNIIESEYNNHFFAERFRSYVREYRPDVVHFFHLSRLSASAIDVCLELGIPTVFTATDFWMVCPTSQLRLPNNLTCTGPDKHGVNCLRHVVQVSQPEHIKRKFRLLPNWLVAVLIQGIRRGLFSRRWFSKYVRALAERPGFLMERLNQVDIVLPPTPLMRDMLVNNGLSSDKVRLQAFGINLRQAIAPSPKGDHLALRVAFIGTLSEHKGLHVLLNALQSLPADLPVEVKIYGDLTNDPGYVQRARQLVEGDARVAFLGTFPNEEIDQVLSGIDVLVVPSLWYENTPLVIFSAQAAGCPVVATNLGGMAAAVHHGENGLLFEKGEHQELAEAIRRLADDRAYLKQLAAAAVPPKSSEDYAAELEAIYMDVLRSGGAAPLSRSNAG